MSESLVNQVVKENEGEIVATAQSQDLIVFSILGESGCSECNKELRASIREGVDSAWRNPG